MRYMVESEAITEWSSPLVNPGDVYGRLTVLSTHRKEGTYKYYAKCLCVCGSSPRYYRLDKLREGHTQSCGCLHTEAVTKHGLWRHPLFPIWSAMMSRCHNPKDRRFSDWGGRGICVCPEWHTPAQFVTDMFPTYKLGLTIERIDNNGHYNPSNCKWAPRREQDRNKSNNVWLPHNAITKILADWAADYSINRSTLAYRLKHGWPVGKALETLPNTSPKSGTHRPDAEPTRPKRYQSGKDGCCC